MFNTRAGMSEGGISSTISTRLLHLLIEPRFVQGIQLVPILADGKQNSPTNRYSLNYSIEVVELSGYCPPSPKSRTNAFSRLSLDIALLERPPRSRDDRSQQIRYSRARAGSVARTSPNSWREGGAVRADSPRPVANLN